MDGNEGLEEEAIEMTVRDEADKTDERIFRVGELVEYSEGSFVRGYRTDSGHPAYVKRVEGGGKYAIKMVGSGRGKYRQIEWRQLFKDGSFNKTVARGHGARVREEARLKERAKEEAEAKLGEELRETKRALEKAEKGKKEIEKQAEYKLKRQEMEARKADKEVTAVHMRQLAEMRGDVERSRDEDIREVRQRKREIAQELEERIKKHMASAETTRVQREVCM